MIGWIAHWIVTVISFLGYTGVLLLMAIESACIPLPSEVIMPFSGYLVSTGRFTLWGITLAGAFGNLIGSIFIYFLAQTSGKNFLISKHHFKKAERFFQKYGKSSVFIGRLLPIVRTFISLPAGMTRVPFAPFCVLTFLGSVPWCLWLGTLGMVMGKNWVNVQPYFHRLDVPIFFLLLAGIGYWIWKK